MYQEIIDNREVEGFTVQTYACEEEIPVRGNVIASGDDAADRAAEDEVLRKLEQDGLQHWFMAKVVVSKCGVELAEEYLGCCSYDSFADFLTENGYHSDMVATAMEAARLKIKELAA